MLNFLLLLLKELIPGGWRRWKMEKPPPNEKKLSLWKLVHWLISP